MPVKLTSHPPWQFTPQSLNACAQYAICHSLVLFEINVPLKQIFVATGISRLRAVMSGTDEKQILGALRELGFDPTIHASADTVRARTALEQMLGRMMPVIICVESSRHWIVIAGNIRGRFIWIDSLDKQLVGAWSWKRLDNWIHLHHNDADRREYYFIGLLPKDRALLKSSIVGNLRAILKLRKQ